MIGEKFLEPKTGRVFKVLSTYAKRAWLVNDDDGKETFRTMHFDRLGDSDWKPAEGIVEFDQFKTPSGSWVILIRTKGGPSWDRDRPYIWYETDGTGEAGLARIVKAAMR